MLCCLLPFFALPALLCCHLSLFRHFHCRLFISLFIIFFLTYLYISDCRLMLLCLRAIDDAYLLLRRHFTNYFDSCYAMPLLF